MAKTKSSVRGTQNKKIVVVKPYTKNDGTKVGGHRRSTPNQNKTVRELQNWGSFLKIMGKRNHINQTYQAFPQFGFGEVIYTTKMKFLKIWLCGWGKILKNMEKV